MATWKITNAYKKSAVERQFWRKDGVIISHDTGYRWGWWTCESEEKPDIDLKNEDGFELFCADQEWEMEEMTDGCWSEWQWPNDMPEEERERIEALWDENWFDGMEEDGWIADDCEHWIYGPLRLVNETTGEEFVGEE